MCPTTSPTAKNAAASPSATAAQIAGDAALLSLKEKVGKENLLSFEKESKQRKLP
jgi:chemotaxis receptor (MCP) glutamine deamidase CheD